MGSTRILLVFIVAIEVAACAGQQHPLTTTAAASLKGRRVAATVRPRTLFLVSEPGKESGWAAAEQVEAKVDAGIRISREHRIPDPVLGLAQQLTEEFAHRYGLRLEPQALAVTADDPTQITAAHPEADLLLDVWIEHWNLDPVSYRSPKYRVRYTAHVRLIDAKIVHVIDGKRGTVIARGSCTRIPEETPNAPTYDDFLANGAQRLIHELDLAAQVCAEELRSNVLTAAPAP